MSKLPVHSQSGEKLGEMDIPEGLLLSGRKGTQAVHDAVVAYLAGQRAGTASTKKRGEVAGSGAKPWRQKGTGRARAGSRRSPIWRGGGVTFGPKPRSFAKKMTRKTARLAFARAFSDCVGEDRVAILEGLSFGEPKTREVAALLKGLKAEKGLLLIVDAIDRNLELSSRNVPEVEVATAASVNTYQLLRFPRVCVTKAAFEQLQGRLRIPAGKAS